MVSATAVTITTTPAILIVRDETREEADDDASVAATPLLLDEWFDAGELEELPNTERLLNVDGVGDDEAVTLPVGADDACVFECVSDGAVTCDCAEEDAV